MSDPYEYWRNALANPAALRAREFRITATPSCGFYRNRRGGAVAIFDDAGELAIQINGYDITPSIYEEVWLQCALRPVTEDAFNQYMATGKWPDMDGAVMASLGDNIANAEDREAIEELLATLLADIEDYASINSDEVASRAAGLRNRINEIRLRADKKRKDEKEPHLKAGQAVDAAWQPLIKEAESGADKLRRAISLWETAKLAAAREAAAREAALRAEQEAANAPPSPPPMPEPAAQVRPAYGRASAVRRVTVVTGISSREELLRYLSATDPDFWEDMRDRAQRLVNAGHHVPGIITEEQARI